MKPGSVILDMAVESGGNVEGSIVDQVVENNGVKIVGISNLASRVAGHASVALSNNIINWITEFFDKESVSINLDFEDEIIKSSVLVHQGKLGTRGLNNGNIYFAWICFTVINFLGLELISRSQALFIHHLCQVQMLFRV